MPKPPLVSVLVPTYNGVSHLDEALRGIAAQKHRNLEVLIRDDGSTDATAEIVARYQRVDARFGWIQDGRRLGSTGNMIELLNRAAGDYIKVCNQDDVLEPACIATLLAPMQRDRRILLSTSARELIDAEGRVLPPQPFTLPLTTADQTIPGRLLAAHLIARGQNQVGEPSTVLFRSGVFSPEETFVLDGVRYEVNNDIALWVKLLLHGDAFYTPTKLSKFRVHGEQRSADLREIVTGTLEWPHLLRTALRRNLLTGPTDVQATCEHIVRDLALVHHLAQNASEAERRAHLDRIASGVAELTAALGEFGVTATLPAVLAAV